MPRYFHLYNTHGRQGLRELSPREYINFSGRNYLIAIVHEDGTMNLTKGKNIITLTPEQIQRLNTLTEAKQ